MLGRILDIAKVTLIAMVVAAVLVFCGDWELLLYKIAKHGNGFGVVTVHGVITTSLKNGKYDVYPQEPVDQSCVHSLFPHEGFTPCWYLQRHSEQISSY